MSAGLVDIHCHIVPGIDDGASTWEESAAMLHEAASATKGALTLVATPHVSMAGDGSARRERRFSEFAAFAREEAPGIRIGFGAEVLLDASPGRARASRMPTYPGSGWVLAELPAGMSWVGALLRLWTLSRSVPRIVLAHPERYRWCSLRPGRLAVLARLGILGQVSGRSFEMGGPAARDTAMGLLEDGLCSFLASDCHCPGGMTLGALEDPVAGRIGMERWDELTRRNPSAVLSNRDRPGEYGRLAR